MVKTLPIFLATLAVMDPMAQVLACQPGLDYCGWVLDKYGGQVWKEKGLRLNGVFRCISKNEAKMYQVCTFGCVNGGTGKSDHC
ncbi:hypothetical protein E4U30_001169 [Claviceps sp. LM220 group G6]|uniref:Uncharacterized protein n=1 Tax=Claviceps arundinis TaxID=1623583 RepID=A0A9P7MXR0_9HYPO|nr:hypothetical protein E4U57_003506 [Claviceps arundinis]KAG5975925.1 hypothetical protein E4U56_002964 [Claviceps arundinis]KAG6096854.1 hypothetical protein E4U30_001169 [Claviceps sp. LM220 group G6]